MHGQLDIISKQKPGKKDKKKLTWQKEVNEDKASHILLLVLLSRVIDLLCVRVLLHASLLEAEKLLHDYNKLFHKCFPSVNGVLNQHVNDAHLIGNGKQNKTYFHIVFTLFMCIIIFFFNG